MRKQYVFIFLSGLIAYVISAAVSYSFFANGKQGSIVVTGFPVPGGATPSVVVDKNEPKTEACPMNGVLYSKTQRKIWESRRPLGAMIENHTDARPQSGLSYADAVYEAVAEGGITRFLAMFYCQDAPVIGPIRSARKYFMDFLSEYGDYPLYAHVGGANATGDADALSLIDSLGWTGYNDLNQFSVGYPYYYRDYTRLGKDVATEHTMYASTAKLWELGKTRGLTNLDKKGNSWSDNFTPYSFKDDASPADRGGDQVIHLEFWSSTPDYFVDWKYNKQNNIYTRYNASKSYTDRDTNKPITTKNLIVMYMVETHANDGYENNVHLLYKDTGSGKAVVFTDGKKIAATWKKKDMASRTLLTDTGGNPIQFDRGTLWFSILPLDGVLNVQ